MDEFCNGSVFWDTNLTLGNGWPEFTECFQNSVLVWVASGCLWVASPFYLFYLMRQRRNPNPVTVKFVLKVILTLCFLAICIIEMVTAVHDLSTGHSYWKAWLLGPTTEAFTLLLVMLFIFLERQKGLVFSGILVMYWTIANLTYIIPFYQKIIKKEYSEKPLNFAVFNVYFGLSLLQLALFCKSDKTNNPENEV